MMHRYILRTTALISALSIALSPAIGLTKEPFTTPILIALNNVESGTITTKLSFALEPLENDVKPLLGLESSDLFAAAGIFEQAEHLMVEDVTDTMMITDEENWDTTQWSDDSWSDDEYLTTYEEPSLAEELAQINLALTTKQNFNINAGDYSDGSFNLALQVLGQNVAVSGDTATRNSNNYLKFTSVTIPETTTDDLPEGVIGDWFEITEPEIMKTIFEPENNQTSDPFEDPAQLLTELNDIPTQVTDIIDDLARINALQIANKHRTIIDGKRVTVYNLKIDGEKAMQVAPEDLAEIAPLLGNTTLKLTVRENTNIPVAFDFAIRVALSDLGELGSAQQVALRGSMTLTDIGRNFSYEPIKNARQFSELSGDTANSETLVNQQYGYITDLQWALNTYYDNYGYYPETLSELLVAPIPSDWSEDLVVHFIPNDVFSNEPYGYTGLEDDFKLTYQIELIENSSWTYTFIEGTNTATAYTISEESDAYWYDSWEDWE